MNKKGFTLIELLAVISILAIVTVIATQAILPYIKDSGKNAFATEASSLVQSSKKAVDMYNLNKLDIENDNNSCIKENIMCFTVEKLIDLGLYKADKNKYIGKVEINIENETNISTVLYFEKENEFNIVSSYKTDFSKNKGEIKNGGFSSNTSKYTTCNCDEFGSNESTSTFTFYLGGSNNPEYTNEKDISTYLNWSYKNITSYCLTEENDSSSCEWKNVSGSSITGNYTLSGEDGEKIIYAYIKDVSGSISSEVSDKILLDTTVPTVTASAVSNNTSSPKISITSSENGTYCVNTSSTIDNINTCIFHGSLSADMAITTSTLSTSGTYYVHIQDSASNIGISSAISITKGTPLGEYLLNNSSMGLNTNLEGGLYRYQGASGSVNNYVCFGTSDKDICLGNTDRYMYRVIGITEDGKVKVMKNNGLSKISWNTNSAGNTLWAQSTIYNNINGSSFLTNSSYVPDGWEDKIEITTWKYGDNTSVNVTADALYNTENAWTSTISAKVGLIYAHDYYYAYQSGGLNCSNLGSYSTCKTSWMHLSASDPAIGSQMGEWTMSRSGYYSSTGVFRGWFLYNQGYISESILNNSSWVRPVFYLINNINFVGGTGTSISPFIIS